MNELNSIDFKSAAIKFTEAYYPQWTGRADRIWKMLVSINVDNRLSLFSQIDNIGDALGIAGDADPEFKEYMAGVAVFAFMCRDGEIKESADSTGLKKRVSLIPFGDMTPRLKAKIESVIEEMFSVSVKFSQQNTVQLHSEKEFTLYLSRENGFGSKRVLVDEEKLHSKYLSDKTIFDIVIYKENVEIKSRQPYKNSDEFGFLPIEMHAYITKLLILFLKFKNDPITALNLYHCAWKESPQYNSGFSDHADVIEEVKSGVSILRKKMEPLANFIIPAASRNSNTYVCKGDFKFCLVHSADRDPLYTLRED